MKKMLLTLIIFLGVISLTNAQEPKLKKIFNGKNLTGWVAPENNTWWTVSDGMLLVKSGPEKKGSILWTEKKYKNFIIVVVQFQNI